MSHLVNPLASTCQLIQQHSLSSLPQDLRESIFIATQCLTQAAGLLLRLDQSLTAQANVILARYWLVQNPMSDEFCDVSAAALFLVGKLGPDSRPPRDLWITYRYLASRASCLFDVGKLPAEDMAAWSGDDADYSAFLNSILTLEARILYALSFNTHVALPHPLAITYLQTFDFLGKSKSSVSLRVVQYLNTALLSPQMLYLTHQPHALATAAIYLTARDVGAKMPHCQWWEVFDVDREELGFLVVALRSLQGWFRRRKEELVPLSNAMLSRDMIRTEMRKRGLQLDNESAHDAS
ncbi:hypothetical protein CDD81_3337 [Ophiocordyceps australis]|uniref:Cyclin N-terminal domain-containing protein n=1 Tax=Ophiocordyceps australis TaxID=1399860 RepID=A0A2C5XE71_9HYPO|nr:hypothetical protein CDD81_3337 [Ophiocordyceps australis]